MGCLPLHAPKVLLNFFFYKTKTYISMITANSDTITTIAILLFPMLVALSFLAQVRLCRGLT
jgi:hypothetical protein